MSETKAGPTEREARKVAEAARETRWTRPSFGKELFLGRLRLDLVDPWPSNSPEQVATGRRTWRDCVRSWRASTARRSSATRPSRTRCSPAWPNSAPSA